MSLPPTNGRGEKIDEAVHLHSPPSDRKHSTSSSAGRDDPRAAYLAAVDRWEEADRAHHRVSVAVGCGTGTVAELAVADARRQVAVAEAIMARGDAARMLTDLVRLAAEDEFTKRALLMLFLEILRPALEPVGDRLAELEQRVTDLETVVAAGGMA